MDAIDRNLARIRHALDISMRSRLDTTKLTEGGLGEFENGAGNADPQTIRHRSNSENDAASTISREISVVEPLILSRLKRFFGLK